MTLGDTGGGREVTKQAQRPRQTGGMAGGPQVKVGTKQEGGRVI